jgi:uncharacterized LabA/DUF88 family protein
MNHFLYVDNSNFWIEGKRLSAVKRGYAANIYEAATHGIVDNAYVYDFGKLIQFAVGTDKSSLKRALLFGSTPPSSDSVWEMAKKSGFEVVTHERNPSNKEKKIDTGITAHMMRDAMKLGETGDTIFLVAGDRDYVPPVELLIQDSYVVEVVFWSHAAEELKRSCTKFVCTDDFLDHFRK